MSNMKKLEKLKNLTVVVASDGERYTISSVCEFPNKDLGLLCSNVKNGKSALFSEQNVLINHNNLLYSICEYLALQRLSY